MKYRVMRYLGPQTPGEAGKKTRKRVVHQPPPPAPSLPDEVSSGATGALPKPLTADRLFSAPGSSAALMASSDFNSEQPEVAFEQMHVFGFLFHYILFHNILFYNILFHYILFHNILFSHWKTTLTTHMELKISLTHNKRYVALLKMYDGSSFFFFQGAGATADGGEERRSGAFGASTTQVTTTTSLEDLSYLNLSENCCTFLTVSQ